MMEISFDTEIEFIDPEFELFIKGYILTPEPENWLAKLLWRFLKIRVKVEKSPYIGALPQVSVPEFKYKIRDIS